MKKIVILFVAFFALLLLTSLNAPVGSSALMIGDKAVDQKSMALISDIYGIDLSKYEVIVNASGASNKEFTVFGPGGVRQFGQYTLVNSQSILYVNVNYANDYLWYCTLDNIEGKPIYAPTVSTDIITQTKNIFANYQTFANQNYAGDTSYINTAKNILNNISEAKTASLSTTDAKMEIKDTQSSIRVSEDENNTLRLTSVKMYFSQGGIDYPKKVLSLIFHNGSLRTITDTWSLVSVGNPNCLSRQDALDLAWVAANNFNLSFISQDGSTYQVKPDLTNATFDISLAYALRNSSELYPLWNIYYYFATPIHGDYGIQVAIWGDTKEIMDCQALTLLGTPDTTPATTNLPTQPTQNSTVWIILTGATVAIIAAILIIWKARTSKY